MTIERSSGMWLKTSDTRTIVQMVNLYGPFAFLYDDMTLLDVAEVAVRTISDLDKKKSDLTFFFDKKHGNIVSDTYGIELIAGMPSICRLERRIERAFNDDGPVSAEVIKGPFMPIETAELLIGVLNTHVVTER